jgi:MFS family permease
MLKRVTPLVVDYFRDSPLRHTTFRMFYFGTVGVALGYTMQSTVAAWLMATLTPSALMVALVQTASTVPFLLFGLAAGTLADIIDRRRIVIITQYVLLLTTAALGAVTIAGAINPLGLLVLTFVVGAAFTFYQPAQQTSINDIVARNELPRAVALGAVAFNVARALGPALAGLIAALFTTGSAFVISAPFFLVMIIAARRWKRAPRTPGIPETLFSGIQTGLRYTRHSPPLRALIIRNVSFGICGSCLWALLPVIARDQLHLGAGGFGLLSAAFGLGAVLGALSIPNQLQRRSLNRVVNAGFALFAASMILVALTEYTLFAVLGTFGCGAAWVTAFASLSAGTQSTAPAWVRARAVSMSMVAVQASLAGGSVIWGTVAAASGTHVALGVSAGVMFMLLVISRRARVKLGDEADVTPFSQAELDIGAEPKPDDGPVLIQLEYRIDDEKRDDFLRAIHQIDQIRRRNGVSDWHIFRDLGEHGRFVERFVVQSWAEYVRSRQRMTVGERRIQERVEKFQREGVEIRVSRLIAINPQDIAAGPQAIPPAPPSPASAHAKETAKASAD